MPKRKQGRKPVRSRPLPKEPLTGCPGEVCRHIASEAIHAISHTLRTGKTAEPERAADRATQEALDKWALGR